jgi:integrase
MICCVYRRGRLYWGKLQLPHELKVSRLSLGTTDRRIAQASLLQIAKEREMEHAGLLSPSSVREAASRPLSELVEAFLADLQVKGRTTGTLDKYRSNLTSCATACRWQFLRDLTARSFCEWRAHCELSRKTVNDTLAVLCTFCRWLVVQRHLAESPLALVQRVDTRGTGSQFRRSLSHAELSAVLAIAPPARRVLYLTAAYTGLRRKELRSLRWADLVLESSLLRVRAATSKNRKDAVLPLHPDLVAALKEFRPATAAPFTPVFKFVPRVSTFRRDLVAAGITFLDSDGRRADQHSLRVTYGTNLTLSGAAPRVVMELMRHSDIKLTMKIYTDAGKLPLADAVSKLPAMPAKTVCPETCPKTCPSPGLGESSAVAS